MMILILLFVFWLAVACLVERYIGPLRERFMPALPRHQVIMVFWITVGVLILATNEALLVPKLLTLFPVALAHVHLGQTTDRPVGWRDLTRYMVHLAREFIQAMRRRFRI